MQKFAVSEIYAFNTYIINYDEGTIIISRFKKWKDRFLTNLDLGNPVICTPSRHEVLIHYTKITR